jgi:hypothetical protein
MREATLVALVFLLARPPIDPQGASIFHHTGIIQSAVTAIQHTNLKSCSAIGGSGGGAV